jgi:hypothetical protein
MPPAFRSRAVSALRSAREIVRCPTRRFMFEENPCSGKADTVRRIAPSPSLPAGKAGSCSS